MVPLVRRKPPPVAPAPFAVLLATVVFCRFSVDVDKWIPPPPDVPVAVLLAIVLLRMVTVPEVERSSPPPRAELLLEIVLPALPFGAVILIEPDEQLIPPPCVVPTLLSIVHE